jgi:hypothetical protein
MKAINHTPMFLALTVVAGCAVDTDLETTNQASAGHPILLPESGTGQNREVMSSFEPLVVSLTDTLGNPLANTTITFTTPTSGASAWFRFGGEVTTDDDGRAELRPYANSISGRYTVWARSDGADPMPFVLMNSAAGPAIILPVIGTNQARMSGMMFADPLTVEVHDNYGNPVANAPVQFVAPMTGATTMMMEGGATVTNDDGEAAVFARAGSVAGMYTVMATVAGAPSIPFVLQNMDSMVYPDNWTTAEHAPTTGTIEH